MLALGLCLIVAVALFFAFAEYGFARVAKTVAIGAVVVVVLLVGSVYGVLTWNEHEAEERKAQRDAEQASAEVQMSAERAAAANHEAAIAPLPVPAPAAAVTVPSPHTDYAALADDFSPRAVTISAQVPVSQAWAPPAPSRPPAAPYNVFEHITATQREIAVAALLDLANDPQIEHGDSSEIVGAVLRAQDKMTIADIPSSLSSAMTASIIVAAQRPATVPHAIEQVITSAGYLKRGAD